MVDAFLGTTSGVLRLHDGGVAPLGLDGHSVTALRASGDALRAGTHQRQVRRVPRAALSIA
jgi:hypothetical protein